MGWTPPGSLASPLPAASAVPVGQVGVDTDGTVVRSNGTSWVAIAEGSGHTHATDITDGITVAVTTTTAFQVSSSSDWGLNGSRPYHNAAGVTSGDEAAYVSLSGRPLLRS